jgi:RimJ/RimL family protein N-acetyltransferase
MPTGVHQANASIGLISNMAMERLVLRQPNPEDLDAMWSIFADPRTSRFNSSGPMVARSVAKDRLDAWILHWHERGFGYWAISEREAAKEVIGFGGLLWRSLPGYPEGLHLGYRLAYSTWGKGLATELGLAALGVAQELGFTSVLAVIAPDNAASIRVIEKLGLRQVGDVDDIPDHPPSLVFKAEF